MKVDIKVNTQYPWNKVVPVEVVVWVDEEVDKIEVIPRASGVKGVFIKPSKHVINAPQKGQRYITKFWVDPQVAGEFRIGFTVISNSGGTINAVNKETILRFSETLELVPITPEYKVLKQVYLASLWILLFLLVVGAIYFLKRLRAWFVQWVRRQQAKPV